VTFDRTRRASFAVLALALCAHGAAGASDIPKPAKETIASITVEPLPSLPNGAESVVGLVSIEGKPALLESDAFWILADDRKSWRKSDLGAPVSRVATDADRAFLLDGGVSRLTLRGAEPLPKPPVALAHAFGSSRGDTLYLAGLDSTGAPRLLRLAPIASNGRWTTHEGWPGGGVPTSLVAQGSRVYLIAEGRHLRWDSKTGWDERGPLPGSIVKGSGRAIGQSHILYLVRGADDRVTLESFHTISDAWAALPYQRTAPIVAAGPLADGIFVAQSRNGGLAFEAVQLVSSQRPLHFLDWSIVAVYLGGMLAVGVYFYMRQKKGSTADFFVGSRSIPFWAAGVSLYATNTSSISYVAIPAKAFETDWQYMMNKIVTVIGLMFVAVWIVPLFRRLNLITVFNYLEMRFHVAIRLFASVLCMLMHVGGRMSIVLFLPALAIATITGTDVVWSILIMGICTIIYTTMGGMRAVVWTDFAQIIVLMGGAMFAIGYVFWSLGGDTVFATATAFDKTKLLNFSFDFTEPTVWGFLFLILLDVVLTFPKDQVLMQRTLATSSEKNAGRSIWIFAAILLPGGVIFYGIGTVLFAYYKEHPERLDPLLPIDATFPLFISAELPTGLTGLIVAGIFAAAMGTVSSTINSVATLLSVDFYERLGNDVTQEKSVRFAEWMSVLIGLVGIGLALLLSTLDIHSLLDLTIELAGLLGGGFAGAYTLGMFSRRANWQGVAIGIATAVVVTLIAWLMKLVHPYFYLGISIGTCIIVGYLASYLFPPPQQSLEGLTVSIGKERRGLPQSIPNS
jgi:solute:Na+ symporter, SSS family